jgi:uncharacterized protein YjiS (DUF1127 family)
LFRVIGWPCERHPSRPRTSSQEIRCAHRNCPPERRGGSPASCQRGWDGAQLPVDARPPISRNAMTASVFGERAPQDRARLSRMNPPFPTEAATAAITDDGLTNHQPSGFFPRALCATLRRWRRRARERAQLAAMSERELHDLGLSHGSLYAELQKPFWRE